MTDRKTILAAVDFSDCAFAVVERALELAGPAEAEVILLHVGHVPPGVPADVVVRGADGAEVTASDVVIAHANERMVPFVNRLRGAGVDCRVQLEMGKPVERILAAAKAAGADTIVMGTHSRTGLPRLIYGSVSAGVSRAATAEVDIIPTVHRPDCEARSCGWCMTHVTAPTRQLAAEADG